MRNGLSARAAACALTAGIGLLTFGGVSAQAAPVGGAGAIANAGASCPANAPVAETPVSTYAQLVTDLSASHDVDGNDPGGYYCLTQSLSDSATSAALVVVNDHQTLDLNGYSLSITHAAAGSPAITLDNELSIEDYSASGNGTLTAVGGSASSTQGAGAGLGSPGRTSSSNGQPAGEDLVIGGGTVTATGGSASGATNGAGAGIGGGGGAPNATGNESLGAEGAGGGDLTVTGGTVIATGGASSASTENDGGAGAGVGGGGGGTGGIGGNAYLPEITGGTLTAIGGASSSSATNDAGAGSGIGGGGGGSSAEGGTVQGFRGNGGTVSVTAGALSGTVNSVTAANGYGDGGGTETGTYAADGPTFISGATTVSGQWAGAFSVYGGATVNVTAGGTLTLSQRTPIFQGTDSDIGGILNVPASSTLNVQNQTLDFTYYQTVVGLVNIESAAQLLVSNANDLTLDDPGPVLGTIDVANDGSTLHIPAGTTLAIDAPGSVNGGTIDLRGTLTGTGAGSLDNPGTIEFNSPSASIPHGIGQNGGLAVTGNAYDLQFSVPSPGTAPADEYVFADTLAEGNESLPAEPQVSGYETNGGWSIDDSTDLSSVASNQVVPVSGLYVANGSVSRNPSTSYGAPSEATITAGGTDTDLATIYAATGGTQTETPTGTETFYVCGPSTIVAYCNSRADQVGSPVTVTAGPDDTATATSPAFTATAAGYYCFNAVYSGDPYNGVSSDGSTDTQCFYAGAAGTEVSTPTASQPETTEGQPVRLSTTVTDTAGSTVPDSGQVTFFVNGTTTLCIASVIDGTASCETSGLPVGTDSVTARYEGNAGLAQSVVSGALQEVVEPNNAFTVESASVLKANAVSVELKVPHTGAVRVALSSGRHSLTRTGKVTLAKSAKSKTVTVKLALKSLLRAVLHGRAGTVKLKLAITYTPAGGKARTVVRTLRVHAGRTAAKR